MRCWQLCRGIENLSAEAILLACMGICEGAAMADEDDRQDGVGFTDAEVLRDEIMCGEDGQAAVL